MDPIDKNEIQIFKEIMGGKYRNHFLVYGRKSTDEPNNQKNSIKYQRAENVRLAEREHLPVASLTLNGFCVDGIISERHSGFKGDGEISISNSGMVQYQIERPKFQRLLQFLDKGLFKGVIVLCWDRISRNDGDNTALRKLIKKGVIVRFVYATYDNTSAGALHMDIDAMFAEHNSRVTAERVKNITDKLREQGVCTYKAPVGYLNEGNMVRKPFDPMRAPIIRQMFELANECWSISDVTKWASAQGLTTVPARRRRTQAEMLAEEDDDVEIEPVSRPLTATMTHKILTNRFYTGKILDGEGRYVESKSHDALVTADLFAKVQSALKRRRVSIHYNTKLYLPGRGRVRCADCTRAYTPYVKKGIRYFNARCREGCPNSRRNFNDSFLAKEVGKCLERLSLTESELAQIDAYGKTDLPALESQMQKQVEQNDRKKRKMKEDLAYLHNNKLTLLKSGVYTPESLVDEQNRLSADINQLEQTDQTSPESMRVILRDVVKLSELLKKGSTYYYLANFDEKIKIMDIIFSELSLSENTLVFHCKKGFAALESRFLSVCDHTGWLSEALRTHSSVENSMQELTKILNGDKTLGP